MTQAEAWIDSPETLITASITAIQNLLHSDQFKNHIGLLVIVGASADSINMSSTNITGPDDLVENRSSRAILGRIWGSI